jgi:hypothetical protein
MFRGARFVEDMAGAQVGCVNRCIVNVVIHESREDGKASDAFPNLAGFIDELLKWATLCPTKRSAGVLLEVKLRPKDPLQWHSR